MSELGKISRVAVALGGFLIFIGVIMTVASALAFYDIVKMPEGTRARAPETLVKLMKGRDFEFLSE